jgi:hypothetical protein
LLKRTPDFSTWSVTIQNSAGDEPAKSSEEGDQPSSQNKPTVVRSSKVVKTAPTIVEISIDGQGKRTEMWHYGGIRVATLPDAPEPMIFTGGGSVDDIYSIDFTKSDFAGLDWISAKAYTGMAKYQGRDCIQFKGEVSPLNAQAKIQQERAIQDAIGHGQATPEKVEVPAVAYIDLETRLPLFVQFGNEKRFYQYGTPPSAALELPAELKSSLKEYAQQLRRLSAPASRAY